MTHSKNAPQDLKVQKRCITTGFGSTLTNSLYRMANTGGVIQKYTFSKCKKCQERLGLKTLIAEKQVSSLRWAIGTSLVVALVIVGGLKLL